MRNVRKIIRIKKQKTQRQQEERIYSGRADRSSGNPVGFITAFTHSTIMIPSQLETVIYRSCDMACSAGSTAISR